MAFGGTKTYVLGFVGVFVGLSVAVSLIPTIQDQLDQITGVPILASGVVLTVIGAGVIVYIIDQLF
jgi:hypothetical protein